MADYWIKVYIEVINDPKMATLPDRLWRRFFELCLLAGQLCPDKSGILPDTRQLAWMLRMNTDDMQTDLEQLAHLGLLQTIVNGWLIVNFQKRQQASTPIQRKRQQREREQKEQYYVTDSTTKDVTKMSRNVTQSRLTEQINRAETETEQSREDAPDPFDETQEMIESVVGVSPVGQAGIDAVREIVEMGATLEDIQAGYDWLKNAKNGKPIQYYTSLVGPIRTAVTLRKQKQPSQQPTPGKKKQYEEIWIGGELHLKEVQQ